MAKTIVILCMVVLALLIGGGILMGVLWNMAQELLSFRNTREYLRHTMRSSSERAKEMKEAEAILDTLMEQSFCHPVI